MLESKSSTNFIIYQAFLLLIYVSDFSYIFDNPFMNIDEHFIHGNQAHILYFILFVITVFHSLG